MGGEISIFDRKNKPIPGDINKIISDKLENSRNSILNLVETKKGFEINTDEELCEILKKYILPNIKILGSGNYGEVYLVETKDKKYVIKVSFEYITPEDKKCIYAEKDHKIIRSGLHVVSKTYKPPVIKEGGYLCTNDFLPEVYFGSLTGDAYHKGMCINFFNYYAFFTCEENITNTIRPYVIMDKVEGPFLNKQGNCVLIKDYIKGVPDEYIDEYYNSIYVQIVFAIAFFQEKFRISHNDLHYDNIFCEYVTEDTMFDGKKVIEYDYFCYEFPDEKGEIIKIYIPACPVIVKIADWGLAYKYDYSTPSFYNKSKGKGKNVIQPPKFKGEIGNIGVKMGDYNTEISPDYHPEYDIIMASGRMYQQHSTKFVEDSVKFIFNIDREEKPKYTGLSGYMNIADWSGNDTIIFNNFRTEYNRKSKKSAIELLLFSKPFQELRKKPKGKILTIGKLD